MAHPLQGHSTPAADEFLSAFHRAVDRFPDPITVLYSGGLDSSLVAFCARESGRTVRLAVIGTTGAPDLDSARDGARSLGLPLSESVLQPTEIQRTLADPALPPFPTEEPTRSVRLAFALAMRSTPGPDLACGQGADELFGGYSHYRGLSPEAAALRRASDLARVREVEWPWAVRTAATMGRRVWAPFLDEEVGRAVLGRPAENTLAADPPKAFLRGIARDHGLPSALADRPKRALQYGSRVRQALPRSSA